MKKRKHLFRVPVSSGPRYRFNLPEDTRQVKLLAFAQGIMNAGIQKEQGLELNAEAIQAGSIEAALQTEQETRTGKQGCNDPVFFRKIFADMCTRIHIAFLDYLEKDPVVYESFRQRPPQQRAANAHQIAELYLDKVEQKIANNQPIEFSW